MRSITTFSDTEQLAGKPATGIRPIGLAVLLGIAVTASSLATAAWYERGVAAPTLTARVSEPAVSRVAVPDITEGLVTRVLHGDTLLLDGSTKIRLIGVNSPSPADPIPEVALDGERSRSFAAGLVEHQRVRLEYEGARRDDYGRLRAHVFLPDGRLLGEELVRAGFAIAEDRHPSRFDGLLVLTDRKARLSKVGLWEEEATEERAEHEAEPSVDEAQSQRTLPRLQLDRPLSAPPATYSLPERSEGAPVPTSTYAEPRSTRSGRVVSSSDGSSGTYTPTRVWPPPAPRSAPSRPAVAENGSYYGEISPVTGRPKTVSVSGYFRRDGTYVRGHYRSRPR